jgi:hypothetical protein
MPSTDPKPELTAKASMAQPVSQPAVYANGLKELNAHLIIGSCNGLIYFSKITNLTSIIFSNWGCTIFR